MKRHRIPASGWYAVFDDEEKIFKFPIIYFELTYDDSEVPIKAVGLMLNCPGPIGISTPNAITREVVYADDLENFIGYLPPGEKLEEWLEDNSAIPSRNAPQ